MQAQIDTLFFQYKIHGNDKDTMLDYFRTTIDIMLNRNVPIRKQKDLLAELKELIKEDAPVDREVPIDIFDFNQKAALDIIDKTYDDNYLIWKQYWDNQR